MLAVPEMSTAVGVTHVTITPPVFMIASAVMSLGHCIIVGGVVSTVKIQNEIHQIILYDLTPVTLIH